MTRRDVDPTTPEPMVEESPSSLLARYAALIDAGDFDGVGQLFARGRITDARGHEIAAGRDRVAELYRSTTRRFEDGTPKTKHLTTNMIVEPDADGQRADVRSYFVVFQKVGAGPLQPVAAGRYHDRLARSANGWYFEERQMIPEMFGDVSNHLLFDPSLLEREDPA
jgi:3-phenylpropionate/cinnamic acid dioxygenase small subunit